ncbi:hypothetical protein ACHAWC_004745 [Mediolabrus comicus]
MTSSFSRIYHRAMSIMTSKALLLAAAAAAAVVCLGSFARQNFRGEIISSSLRSTTRSYELLDTTGPLSRLKAANSKSDNGDSYFVFLQKFPLENTWGLLFHTEVVVCNRHAFDEDFITLLDSLAEKLSPSADEKVPFVQVPEEQWIKQSESKCVELGYGGGPCTTPCCGSPHRNENTNYALNSRQAVISNAVGEEKQLFLYGKKDGISGMDAYRAVCQNKRNMMAVIDGGDKLPKCVSNWSGEDYNPITNNCNTYTSTVLKCVYGLSDQKPNLGVSDMVRVTCPTEKSEDGEITHQCLIPTETTVMNILRNVDGETKKEE